LVTARALMEAHSRQSVRPGRGAAPSTKCGAVHRRSGIVPDSDASAVPGLQRAAVRLLCATCKAAAALRRARGTKEARRSRLPALLKLGGFVGAQPAARFLAQVAPDLRDVAAERLARHDLR